MGVDALLVDERPPMAIDEDVAAVLLCKGDVGVGLQLLQPPSQVVWNSEVDAPAPAGGCGAGVVQQALGRRMATGKALGRRLATGRR